MGLLAFVLFVAPGMAAGQPMASPAEVAYRVVGRALILVDVKSWLIVDIARFILPPSA